MLSRFPRRRDAWAFIGLGSLAMTLSLMSVLASLAFVGKTFPGFLVWDNLVVVSLGRPDWTGVRAGLPFRPRVVAIDGVPIASSAALLATVRASPAGTLHEYVLESQGERETHTIASMLFTGRDYLLTMGVYAFNGAAFLLSGLAVFYLKPESRQSRALLTFGMVWGLTLLLCPDLFTASRLGRLYFVLQGMFPAAALHQALVFPEPRWPVKRSTRPLVWLYLCGFTAGVAEVFAFWRNTSLLLAIDNGIWLAVVPAGLLAMGTLAVSAFRAASPLARRRARVVLAGSAMAFLVPIALLFVMFLFEESVSASWLALTGFAFPLSIGYAVARHDLFEADRFVRLSLEYTVLTAIVTLMYGGIVFAADRMAAGLAIRHNPAFPVVFALAGLATVVPLRARVQGAVDRLFYRERVDYKTTVARASERLTTLLERDAIVEHVVTTLRDVLFLESSSVWERNPDDDDVLVRRGPPPAAGPQQLRLDAPWLREFLRRGRPLSRDEIEESPRFRTVRSEASRLFMALDATLLVPFTREGEPSGMLAVGQKASGGPLSADDVDVLRTIANQVAVSLATAAAVEARREAFEQLRRSEQLAAIGELSTAVAHGIRNPLAGIRLAAQLGLEATSAAHPVRENLEDVLCEVDKLEAQVRGILDFARPFEPTLEPVDLGGVLSPLLRTLFARLDANHIVAETDLPRDLPPVRADRAHLGQALLEILGNACDAMPDGGRITIAARLDPEQPRTIRLTLSDTGPGIPPELRERVFRLFATTKKTGTGVGLAVARKIIERHGGKIAIEGAEPHGARFVISLPAA